MKTINIFLDLEETIIDNWEDGFFLHHKIANIKRDIEKLLEKFGVNKFKFNKFELHIFSFAIVNDKDLELFESGFKNPIEAFFNHVIRTVFVANDKNLFKLAKHKGLSPMQGDSPNDLFGNMKQEAFREHCLMNHKNEICILFDDVVQNSVEEVFHKDFMDHENSTEIFCIKV